MTSPTTRTSIRHTAGWPISRPSYDEAHRRDIRVITELIINHTSDQHPWFQRARRAKPGSKLRDFYVWSDTDQKFPETRIIFVDTEKSNWAWDPVAQAYYWHRFYSHQPDLNFDNPRVFRAVVDVMRFWLDLGVDGMRLDAVPYLIEREGTINENLPETHEVLRRLRRELDMRYSDRMLLAEANQWPEDVLQYFGAGDECHMAFHFPLMPRIYMAVATEDRHPIADIMRQTPDIPETCQWAVFLRNHDELTLEMVTDRERDYLVELLCRRPAGAAEPRHSPPARAADGERPAQDRAVERAVDLDAGNPGVLLRRRNRHGRQCLSRRSRRRAHADAMVVRPQWRIFPRRPGAALPAADHGPGLRLRGGQCRGADPLAFVTAELGQAADRGAPLAARVWPRHPAVPLSVQSQGHRLSARLWRRNRPVRRQFVAHSAGGRTRSIRLARPPAGRAARAQRLSADRRIALSPHPAGLQLFLVRAPTHGRRGREPANGAARISHPGDAAWLAGSFSPAQPAAARE